MESLTDFVMKYITTHKFMLSKFVSVNQLGLAYESDRVFKINEETRIVAVPMEVDGTGVELPEKDYFTTGQVSKLLGISARTVCKLFDRGTLEGYRILGGSDRRISRQSLLKHIQANNLELKYTCPTQKFDVAPKSPQA